MQKKLTASIIVIFILQSSIIFVKGNLQSENNDFTEIIKTSEEPYKYYTYQKMTNLLYELQENYSDIISFKSYGKTHQGRDIWIVKISDNVDEEEDEPGILYTGGMHGNENPGYEVVIYSLKAIVENYTHPYVNESFTDHIRNIVNNTELYFIPMINPDGVEANVRKNRQPNFWKSKEVPFKGVDLNRNFDYNWDDVIRHPFRYITIPRTIDELEYIIRTKTVHLFEKTSVILPFLDWRSLFGFGCYRGPYPFSEKETQAVKQFFDNHTITISVDYHIYGNVIGYPQVWDNYTSESDKKIFISIAQNISKINNYTFQTERIFKWANSSGLLLYWAYDTHHTYSFVIELCDSNKLIIFPNPEEILKLCDTHLLVNLYLAKRAHTLAS